MPIEIKELHIKAVVSPNDKEPRTGLQQQDISKLKKEITKEVTEKILRALRQKNER
jgi:DNA-binding Xre family transcriptional regulator